jgi:hypothetical protein
MTTAIAIFVLCVAKGIEAPFSDLDVVPGLDTRIMLTGHEDNVNRHTGIPENELISIAATARFCGPTR